MESLSFNKRISLVKSEVFTQLSETKELESIKGSQTSGFYSLSTIEKYLNPALQKYDLDLDLEIFTDKIIGHWYDCLSEKERSIEIDFHRIENVEKLQLMANLVQSEGAVKSYTRRYALTSILRLPSTDLIDKTAQQPQQQPQQPQAISQNQITRYYAILKSKKLDKDVIDSYIKTIYDISSLKFWLTKDYNNITKFLQESATDIIIEKLKEKIVKLGKEIPKNGGK